MRTLLTFLAFCACTLLPAQKPWSLGARGYYGFLWPHNKSMWLLVQGHAPAVEVYAERTVKGDRQWHHDFRMPSYGIGFLWTSMGDAQYIGSAVRIAPYLRLPFTGGAHSSLGMRLGWGIGYVAKSFGRVDDPKQIAIGTKLNTAIELMLDYRVTHGTWSGMAGLGVDHWSNGSFKLPNLGLNYLALSIGVSKNFGSPVPVNFTPDTTAVHQRREIMVMGAFAENESVRPLEGQHTVYSLTSQVQWRVSRKSGLAAGVDFFNKGSLVTGNPELRGKDRIALTQFGVHGGYALLMGKAEIFLQMGAYILTPVPDQSAVYHRLGGRLRVGKHMLVGIALKSHFATADHWELGIGYRWN